MTVVNHPIALVSTFLWIGFVCAISFLEAWLKFRAPGVTLPMGLGIGRLVFAALNKIEWVFAIAITVYLVFSKWQWMQLNSLFLIIPIILLLIQTLWLLPALDARAEMHIQGAVVPPSNLHFYFVGMELVKVTGLFVWGIRLFKSIAI